jgi:hypothetical protein
LLDVCRRYSRVCSDSLRDYPRIISKALRYHERRLLKSLKTPEVLRHIAPDFVEE